LIFSCSGVVGNGVADFNPLMTTLSSFDLFEVESTSSLIQANIKSYGVLFHFEADSGKLHQRDQNCNEMVSEQWTLCQQKED
jgi:hypothetical protein